MDRGTRKHLKALRRRARKAGKYVYKHRRSPQASGQRETNILQEFMVKLNLAEEP